jgi:Domain of Unknown Function with PDB structure (DUF3857)/Transglutaminase-like superfamily
MSKRLGPFAFTLLASFLSIPAFGQFQEPTPEELHMTSDPKAPGASAVFLYLEEKTDDAFHFHTYYARIKVLTEKGRESATVRVPYEHGPFQVAAIEGRTIHSDGTIIPLRAKPSDLLDYRSAGHQYNVMTFTLPGAEVGSILEYRLQIRYGEGSVSSPLWNIQQDLFVHKAHYFFNPVFNAGLMVVDKHNQIADGLMYSSRLRSGGPVRQDSLHRYILDVTDVPPLPSGDWLPPLNTIRESVIFYYTNANSGPEFWDKEGKFWARDAEHFLAPSGPVKKQAADLIAPGDTEQARARKLYDFVMKLDNRDYVRSAAANSKTKTAKDAASILKQQGGSGDQLTLLFIALARAAGIQAWPMQVVNRDRAEYEPTFLSMDQFDDYIAVAILDGKQVYLDPGQKMCPFGVLHWKHELATGFRLTDQGAIIAVTPAGPPKAAGINRTADITLDDSAHLTGTGSIALSGQEALYWRQLALQEDPGALSGDFKAYLGATLPEGVAQDLVGFDGLTDYESDLIAHVNFSGTLGSATGKRLILPGLFFQARDRHPFLDESERNVPVDLHYATIEQDRVAFHLPAGMTLVSTPNDPRVEWADHIKMTVQATPSEGVITVERSFINNSALLDPSLYNTLRYIYKRIANADQQPIVVEHPSGT